MHPPAHMADEPRTRVFLALAPPMGIRKQIGTVQTRLRQQWRGGVRWVHLRDIHLTLKFLGGITAREIATVCATVREITATAAPLALEVCRLGAFPNVKKPRVLWLGFHGDIAPLMQLQRVIDERLASCGFEIEERPFRPHLTVARLKTPRTLSGLEDVVEQGAEFTAGRFTARELTLMKSELTPRGAVYTALARFPLRTNHAAGASCPIISP